VFGLQRRTAHVRSVATLLVVFLGFTATCMVLFASRPRLGVVIKQQEMPAAGADVENAVNPAKPEALLAQQYLQRQPCSGNIGYGCMNYFKAKPAARRAKPAAKHPITVPVKPVAAAAVAASPSTVAEHRRRHTVKTLGYRRPVQPTAAPPRHKLM
jgi:hypothetical protein